MRRCPPPRRQRDQSHHAPTSAAVAFRTLACRARRSAPRPPCPHGQGEAAATLDADVADRRRPRRGQHFVPYVVRAASGLRPPPDAPEAGRRRRSTPPRGPPAPRRDRRRPGVVGADQTPGTRRGREASAYDSWVGGDRRGRARRSSRSRPRAERENDAVGSSASMMRTSLAPAWAFAPRSRRTAPQTATRRSRRRGARSGHRSGDRLPVRVPATARTRFPAVRPRLSPARRACPPRAPPRPRRCPRRTRSAQDDLSALDVLRPKRGATRAPSGTSASTATSAVVGPREPHAPRRGEGARSPTCPPRRCRRLYLHAHRGRGPGARSRARRPSRPRRAPRRSSTRARDRREAAHHRGETIPSSSLADRHRRAGLLDRASVRGLVRVGRRAERDEDERRAERERPAMDETGARDDEIGRERGTISWR